MKNPFNLFGKAKEVKGEKFSADNEADSALERMILKNSFAFIPPQAFARIYGYPEYRYLKSGLYVSETKLLYDDEVAKVAPDSFSPITTEGETLLGVTWKQAKEISKELGGKMLTPAEYFCVLEYAQNNGMKEFEKNLTSQPGEWLDAIIYSVWDSKKVITSVTTTHTEIKNGKIDGGNHLSTGELISHWFTWGDIDRYKGFPKKFSGVGDFHFSHPKDITNAVARINTHKIISDPREPDYRPAIASHFNTDEQYLIGMRLCYTGEMPKKKEDMKGRK